MRHMLGCHACCRGLSRHERDSAEVEGDVAGSGTPPVPPLASVEQQEPKQAGSEVKSDTEILVHWSRPRGRTETRV